MTDLGSRIKNKQKSLAGATNHPAGVGNASLTGWFILLIKEKTPTCSLVVSLPFATGIQLIQIYYLVLVSQVTTFPIKEGARFWSPLLSSALLYPSELSTLTKQPSTGSEVLELLIHF